ncbi:MAG: 2-C-methyl-D-erythritol 4-phosphate cytidylyltransferase [Candidatus Binataceae bacterium]|nr:2-C-methyl-D-erythritol 4-phosphate cytidylyltransferase [Candidatus Binataceae bacterium]
MKASAILVAAGSGSRLGSSIPKAFVKLGSHTLLHYCLRAIAQVAGIEEAVITAPSGMESMARAEARSAALEIPVKITPGGVQRQDSVRIALALTSAESECVVIHDVARPFATPAMFAESLRHASACGGAITAIPVADTLKRVAADIISSTIPRLDLYQAQTPQAFRRDLLIRAHREAIEAGTAATDDADLVERIGGQVRIVEGSAKNFKITTQADFELALALMEKLA